MRTGSLQVLFFFSLGRCLCAVMASAAVSAPAAAPAAAPCNVGAESAVLWNACQRGKTAEAVQALERLLCHERYEQEQAAGAPQEPHLFQREPHLFHRQTRHAVHEAMRVAIINDHADVVCSILAAKGDGICRDEEAIFLPEDRLLDTAVRVGNAGSLAVLLRHADERASAERAIAEQRGNHARDDQAGAGPAQYLRREILNRAITSENFGVVKVLLQFKASHHLSDVTPICRAASNQKASVLRLLLEAKANAADEVGRKCLRAAVNQNSAACAQLLLEMKTTVAGVTTDNVCVAARRGNVRLLQLLVGAKADVAHTDVVYAAAAAGRYDHPDAGKKVAATIRFLASAKCNVGGVMMRGNCANTVLYECAAATQSDQYTAVAIQALLLYKADVEGACGDQEAWPLYVAVRMGKAHATVALLQAKASVEDRVFGAGQRLSLMLRAVTSQNQDIARLLVDTKCDVNQSHFRFTREFTVAQKHKLPVARCVRASTLLGVALCNMRNAPPSDLRNAPPSDPGNDCRARTIRVLLDAKGDVRMPGITLSPLNAAQDTTPQLSPLDLCERAHELRCKLPAPVGHYVRRMILDEGVRQAQLLAKRCRREKEDVA